MPVSQISDAPDSIKELAAKAGGDEKVKLSLSQVNWILERYDAMKSAEEKGDIDSAMAVAISQFRQAFEVKDGKWAEKPKEKTRDDSTCPECGSSLPVDDVSKAAKEAEKEAQKARAEKYGIAPKAGGNVTKPKEYADIPDSSYGDPCNYKYPADAAHARSALGYFNHSDAREKGGYSSAEWKIIGGRLAKLVSQHLDAKYEYKDGKLQQKPKKKVDESYDDIAGHIRDAWYARFDPRDEAVKTDFWIKEVFPDYVIAETSDGLMRYSYTEDADGNVAFGEPSPVERVYVPRPGKATIIKAFAKALYLSLVKKQNLPVWQDKDGVKWYTAVISTALVDEEKEIVTEAGMDFSIQLCRKYGIQPGLHIQHEVPETRIGDCLFEARVGPFWVELGQFCDTWLADKAFSALQKDEEGLWSISIGFLTPASQQRKGIYTKLLRFDSSVTDEPANLWTAIAVGGKTMSMESIMRLLKLDTEDEAEQAKLEKALEELLGTEAKSLAFVGKGPGGDELAAAMLRLESLEVDETVRAEVQEVLALLDQAGKVLLPTDDSEPAPDAEPDPEPDPESPLPDVSGLLTDIQGKLDDVIGRLAQVEQAQQAVTTQAAITKALLQRLPKASIQRPTADAPDVPDADAAIAALQKELSNRSAVHPLAGMAGAPPAQGG